MRDRVWPFAIPLAAGISILAVLVALPSQAQRAPSSLPVPSSWSGLIEGTVGGTAFRLPAQLELGPALSQESNPFHLFIGAGEPSRIGNLYLSSAQGFLTPETRRQVTLQYLTIRPAQGGWMHGLLSDDHAAAAAAVNGFTGPNMAAVHAPPIMRDIYGSMGPTALYAFRTGTGIILKLDGRELVGRIEGSGRDIINIFPAPDPIYQAEFRLSRNR